MWKIDNWRFLERHTVADAKGRKWSVALMDVLGQEGDPEMPGIWAELQYASGRYFALIFSDSGTLQREHGYGALADARTAYDRLVAAVEEGRLDPSQPVFRDDLED